jgi:hypothetical protein
VQNRARYLWKGLWQELGTHSSLWLNSARRVIDVQIDYFNQRRVLDYKNQERIRLAEERTAREAAQKGRR